MTSIRLLLIAAAWILLATAGAYGYLAMSPSTGTQLTGSQSVTLNGGGATLAYPLLTTVIASYTRNHPEVSINYQPFGSEAGINQFTLKTVDFGATYPPLNPTQKVRAPTALQIPESISAVAISYNIQGMPQGLNLTRDILVGIFLFQITKWSDTRIATINPRISLPDKAIVTIRADDAGSTFVFTGFLSLNATWQSEVSQSITPQWCPEPLTPAQCPYIDAPADAQVASLVQSTPNSIGYMELSYALESHLNYAAIQNDSKNFVAPSFETTKAAADRLRSQLPDGNGDWSEVNLLDEPGQNAYPLVTFTYLLVYRDLSILPSMNLAKATVLVDFIWYLVHDGQTLGQPLDYSPLPSSIVAINEISIRSMTFQGQQLFTR